MPRSRKRRPKPPNRLARHTAPLHVFVTGALVIVAFLFQQDLVVRVAQVLLFAILATLAGKRIRWGYFAIMVSSITFFNLLTPVGRVLLELGPFAVTEGALEQGLLKGFAIVGLVFISLFAVRSDLQLPGTLGGILGRLFYYFERVLDTRRRVSAARLVESVDDILMELYPPEGAPAGSAPRDAAPEAGERASADAGGTDALGAVLLVGLVGVNVALAVVF